MSYPSFADLADAARQHGSLAAAALEREVAETGATRDAVRSRMRESLTVMREAVAAGLTGDARSRSGLTGGAAALVAASEAGPLGATFSATLAAALATAEVNAAMGRIVAAPTGGASGVLPAVLLTLAKSRDAGDEDLVDALFAAAAVGGVIAARATLAGSVGGCQAEVGSGAGMAAAGAVVLCGGSTEQAGHAAALALTGLMGLVCDPVGGLVEIPCVHRNATGAAVALAAVEMALAGVTFPIPLDQVIDAQAQVGRSLPPSLRETALGGLAATPAGKELGARARRP